MKKRVFSLLLVVVMIFSLVPAAFAQEQCDWEEYCPTKKFVDVPVGAWYHDAVDMMVVSGLMSGTWSDTFMPEKAMTRAMVASVFYRAFEEGEAIEAADFADVPADAWYAQAVALVSEMGIMKGTGYGNFEPERTITRQEMAVVYHNLMKVSDAYLSNVEADLTQFGDADKIADWAKESMEVAIYIGAIQGTDLKMLNPTAALTRAEFASMVVNTDSDGIIFAETVVGSEEELVEALQEGGSIVCEEDVTLPNEIIAITEDTELYLLGDLDASASTSRPFTLEDASLTIYAEGQTITAGKYGLVNILGGDADVYLYGGTYLSNTDNGSLIKPRGEGYINIYLENLTVKDESTNGGWLVNGVGQTGEVCVTVYGGTYEGYNGISGTTELWVDEVTMTFVHNAINVNKVGYISNSTITVLNGGTATEEGNAPSSCISVDNNGYAEVENCILDGGSGHALSVYTSGGTMCMFDSEVISGTFAEYHPRDHYPEAEFEITVDGEIPEDLLIPTCEGKTPCADCKYE